MFLLSAAVSPLQLHVPLVSASRAACTKDGRLHGLAAATHPGLFMLRVWGGKKPTHRPPEMLWYLESKHHRGDARSSMHFSLLPLFYFPKSKLSSSK